MEQICGGWVFLCYRGWMETDAWWVDVLVLRKIGA